MRRRTPLCVLTAVLVVAAGSAPAAGQERRIARLPPDLWDPPAAQAAAADGSDRDSALATLLLTGLAFGAAAVAGFLLTGVRRPAPAPAPPPRPRPAPRSRAPRLEGCSIALARSTPTSEFRVVAGKGPETRIVGRSQSFPAPRSGRVPDEGPPRAAFDELIGRLEAVGWQPVSESDVWYHVQLVRPRRDESAPPVERASVDAFGDGFAAFALDDYGNRQRLAERAVAIDESPAEAHAALVADLQADGWQVDGEGEEWFATALTRRRLTLVT